MSDPEQRRGRITPSASIASSGAVARWRSHTCAKRPTTRSDGRIAPGTIGRRRARWLTAAAYQCSYSTRRSPRHRAAILLTNQDEYSATYNGLVVAVDRRRVNGWQAFGSYTWSRAYGLQPSSETTAAGEQTNTIGPGGISGRDPNDLTDAQGRLPNDRPHVLRAMAAIDVPRTGLLFAANLQHVSGKPWAASTVVPLPQNREQRILLEPRGSRRLSSQALLDLRLSRAFCAGRLGRLELLVDVLNVLNDTAQEGIVTDALTTATILRVPTLGMPNVFVDPRRAMVGMRIDLGRPF